MTMTMIIVTLMVLFGALLIGKMLMEMFPNSGFGARKDESEERRTPAE